MKSTPRKVSAALLALVLLAGCDSATPTPTDELTNTQLLGTWQLVDRTINHSNISNMLPLYGSLDLRADDRPDDFAGNFTRTEDATTQEGSFTVDTAAQTLTFAYDGQQLTSDYRYTSTSLVLEYLSSNDTITETWQPEQ